MSSCAINTLKMSVDKTILIQALKGKREKEGLSLRKLSEKIGVSFSSLARIERGDGQPDNNSTLRILEWLGTDGRDAGLTFENVALVHFRAAKNVSSKTTEHLLEAADVLKNKFSNAFPDAIREDYQNSSSSEVDEKALSLSKSEMEEMAEKVRSDLGLKIEEKLNALSLRIAGVEVFVPHEVEELSQKSLEYLTGSGSNEWSAMSVPINIADDKWAILRNDTHTEERQRVTYLEECWHILLGHKLTKIARIGAAYGRTYESTEEHDAYYIAAATLLPANGISSLVDQKLSSVKIGETYGTSPALVEYRIKRLGLWRRYKGIQISFTSE